MGARTSRIRQFVAAMLLLVPAVLVARDGVYAQYATIDELAYGEETGYFFYWDPTVLALDERSSEPDVDYWRLSDGEATVEILAYTAPGATTAECVRGFLDAMEADPATVSLESLPFLGGGPPQIQNDSLTEIVRTTLGPNGRESFAELVSCWEIIPGQSLALEYVHMPVRTYNERGLRDVRIDGIDPNVHRLLNNHAVLKSILDGSGDAVGALAVIPPCNRGVVHLLAKGGDSAGQISIDPASFIAVDINGGDPEVATDVWSLPEARRATSLNLGPGEIGLLRVVVELEEDHDFELYYTRPTGAATFLTRSGGCGAAGAAPEPIDID